MSILRKDQVTINIEITNYLIKNENNFINNESFHCNEHFDINDILVLKQENTSLHNATQQAKIMKGLNMVTQNFLYKCMILDHINKQDMMDLFVASLVNVSTINKYLYPIDENNLINDKIGVLFASTPVHLFILALNNVYSYPVKENKKIENTRIAIENYIKVQKINFIEIFYNTFHKDFGARMFINTCGIAFAFNELYLLKEINLNKDDYKKWMKEIRNIANGQSIRERLMEEREFEKSSAYTAFTFSFVNECIGNEFDSSTSAIEMIKKY